MGSDPVQYEIFKADDPAIPDSWDIVGASSWTRWYKSTAWPEFFSGVPAPPPALPRGAHVQVDYRIGWHSDAQWVLQQPIGEFVLATTFYAVVLAGASGYATHARLVYIAGFSEDAACALRRASWSLSLAAARHLQPGFN